MNMKVKFDFNSIKFRLWLYFLTIAIVILVLIWFLQVFLLNNSYENMKIKQVSSIAAEIKASYLSNDEYFTQKIQQLSVANDYYAIMQKHDSLLLFYPGADSTAPINQYAMHIPDIQEKLMLYGPNSTASIEFNVGMADYSTLGYGIVIDSTEGEEIYLYIFSPLYPVNSTVQILKDQLSIVTIVAFLLAFLLAFIFSIRISKPIKGMTVEAKKLSEGNFNVEFVGKSYSEVNRLADTLNTSAYEMASSDKRQKDLIANVSHDLKTPITMIRSYAEMIRDLSGDNPEKRNAHLKVIIDESDRMANLVSDMTSISKLRSDDVELNLKNFDLVSCTASIIGSYDLFIEQHGYSFKFSSPKEALCLGDEGKIKQVITNLIDNAVKYCGEDKEVSIKIQKSGKSFRLEVSDHGPGISKEDLPHVWDRYYKASANYVRPTEGSGLGLSIVKEILILHGANYGVNSEIGKGSTFWFELNIE